MLYVSHSLPKYLFTTDGILVEVGIVCERANNRPYPSVSYTLKDDAAATTSGAILPLSRSVNTYKQQHMNSGGTKRYTSAFLRPVGLIC